MLAVEPNSEIIPFLINIEQSPLSHDNYKIYNIGYADIYVELLYGTSENWETVAAENIVKPGQTIIFDNVGKLFQVSGLKISNKTDLRAIVFCAHVHYRLPMFSDLESNFVSRNYENNLRSTYFVGVKYVPYISKKYRGLYNAFWPLNQPSVWEEIFLKLLTLLNQEVVMASVVPFKRFMRRIQQKLEYLSVAFDEGLHALEIYYMEIAGELCQVEKYLIPQDNNVKYLLLPLYSNFILLKTTFYALGVITSSDIGLSTSNLLYIETLLRVESKNATRYIDNVFDTCLNFTYNTCRLADLYNFMMNVRTYVGIHGFEFTRIWNNIVRSPFTGDRVYNDVITYSNFFGRQTPNLIREATCKKMYPPLTPRYIGFICNYLTSIEIFFSASDPLPESRKIGGMRLIFADHTSYMMGSKTEVMDYFSFFDAYIKKLKVTGTGAVDSLTFYMSDGRILLFGTIVSNSKEKIFQLKDHRIVSLFLSSDDESLGGQAANIAVSYRLNSL